LLASVRSLPDGRTALDLRRSRTALHSNRSHRVWDVQEHVSYSESLGEVLAESPDAEGLGGVVAGRDEVKAGLSRLRQASLGGLAGKQPAGPGDRRARGEVGAGARDDRQTASPPRPGVEHERLTGGHLADAREQLARREALAWKARAEADRLAAVKG